MPSIVVGMKEMLKTKIRRVGSEAPLAESGFQHGMSAAKIMPSVGF